MFSVAPYLIQLLDEQQQPLDLWKFHGNNNLRSALIDYYTSEKDRYTQFESNRIFRIPNVFESNEMSVAGTYQTGEFGYSGHLYDTKQKKISHKKQTSEADMVPFQFTFITPKSDIERLRQKGLLLLARHKSYGVRTITIPHLKLHIEKRFPGVRLDIKRLMPATLARLMLQKGHLQAIRLIKHKLPSTLEGLLDEPDKEVFQDVEIVIKAKRNKFFSPEKFLKILEGKADFQSLYSIGEMSCNNVKLDIEIGGRSRRINVGSKLVKSDIEITEEIEVDASGYPTNKSWFSHIDELANQLFIELGVEYQLETSIKELEALSGQQS